MPLLRVSFENRLKVLNSGISLSEALLLFNEEVKTPTTKGNPEIRIKRLTKLLNTDRGEEWTKADTDK